ncbi:MAG: signal peptidase I [Gammaproteobacteria bacterium]|nr:signal peptidase I [Gammaproteobacteria bacterium]
MNFELILVSLTLVAGIIWGLEALYRRVLRAGEDLAPSQNILVEYSRSFFPVLLFVVIVRSFLFEPFRIPSGSMIPTLVVGDFIVVSKYAYGLRLPVLHTKILELDEPERGDVMVFRFPADTRVNYIKRLVGLPGDVVEYRNRRLTINGEAVPLELIPGGRSGVELAIETLGDVRHKVRHEVRLPSKSGRFEVPENHYFMMGDNRDRSLDSRFDEVGFVPAENVVGKAVRIWMSWDFTNAPQWGRIGSEVR